MALLSNKEQTEFSRRGFPVYVENPSIEGIQLQQREKPMRIVKGNTMMLVDEATGEITGRGTAAFLQREVVDPEKFVKVYLDGLNPIFELTKTGQRIFKMLWLQIQDNPNADRVELTPYMAVAKGIDVSRRSFYAGVRELLDKGFIFMSSSAGLYFINMKLIFNGNRVVVAREYLLRGSPEAVAYEQPTLNLEAHGGDK